MRKDKVREEPAEAASGAGVLGLLASLRVTIALLVVLGVVCAFGTLVPAGEDWADVRRFLVAGLGRLLLASGLDRPFTSTLFRSLLALLTLNLVLCTWRRLPAVLREVRAPRVPTQAAAWDQAEFRATAEQPGAGFDQREQEVGRALAPFGYRRAGDAAGDDGGRVVLFRRGAWAPLGPHLTHVGVFLLFLGGAVGWHWAVEGYGEAPRGGSFDVQVPAYYRAEAEQKRIRYLRDFYEDLQHENALRTTDKDEYEALERREAELTATMALLAKTPLFTVRVLDAREDRYPSGEPRGWTSDLEVVEQGVAVARQAIEVNTPLSWRGVDMYQRNFAMRGGAEGPGASHPAGTVVAELKRPAAMEDLALALEVVDYYPDFAVRPDEKGTPQAYSRSDEPKNQAVRVRVKDGAAAPRDVFLFTGEPYAIHEDPAALHTLRLTEVTTGPGPRQFHVAAFGRQGVPVTGIGLQRDPGTPVVWAGCICLLAGMLLAFAVEQRRVVARLDGQGRLSLIGLPSKYPGLFREEFQKIAEALRARVAGSAPSPASGGETA